MHARNVLVSAALPSAEPAALRSTRSAAATLRLAALIDFGDLSAGDPATDLAIAWTAFDEPGRESFRAAYGLEREAPLWQRARGWALALSLVMLGSDDDPVLSGLGRHGLRELLAER